MKNQIDDYGFNFTSLPILCDITSAISIANNLVQLSLNKHMNISYHLIHDHAQNGDTGIQYVDTNYQLADVFTKPLDEYHINTLIGELDMLNLEYSVTTSAYI